MKTLRVNLHYFSFLDSLKFPILISRHCKIRKLGGIINFHCPLRPGMVRFGFDMCGLIDYGHDRSILEIDGTLDFYGSAVFGAASKIIILKGGRMIVNDDVKVTGRSSFLIAKEVSIGRNALISWDVQIMDTDFHKIYSIEHQRINDDQNIYISDDVWIGSRCTILKGSVIPSESIIAANSLVSGKLSDKNCIYGGVPAKVIKNNINWEL